MAGLPTVVSPKEMFILVRHGPEYLILAFERQRGEENHEFEASLGYVARAFLTHKQTSKKPTSQGCRSMEECLPGTNNALGSILSIGGSRAGKCTYCRVMAHAWHPTSQEVEAGTEFKASFSCISQATSESISRKPDPTNKHKGRAQLICVAT